MARGHVAARVVVALPVALERPAGGWLGHVAARVVASCLGKACGKGFGGFGAFEGGQMAGLNALKDR